jgi:lipoprotein-anchoring transpeptidase ErfK/SrfK
LAGAVFLGVGLGFGVMTVPTGGAQAQGVFGFWDEAPQTRKIKKPRTQRATKQDDSTEVALRGDRSIKGPLVLSVSLAKQRVTVYDSTEVVAQSPISSGRVGYATPAGVYTIIGKERMHYSNLYQSAPMPNMQRITWSGVALHAGALPGYAASHGCIRLPHGFSQKLFGMTKMGERVIVSREPVAPVAISHERLFNAYPPEGEMTTASISTQVADASNSTVGSSTSVSHVLGMTAAAAAETPQPLPRSPYRVRRENELNRITADIRTAGYMKADTSVALAQAAKAADAARAPYMKARPALDKLDMAARKAESVRDSAQREIASIDDRKSSKRKLNGSAERKLDEKRATLEAKLPSLVADAEAARAEWQVANEAAKPLETAMMQAEATRRAAFAEVSTANAALSKALGEEDAIKRQDAKRAYPVSVFISRKTQRLYVRQGYEPILDVPVTFDRADEVVGTHVFTALHYVPNKTEMSWTVVSIPTDASGKSDSKKSKKDKSAKADMPAPATVPASRQTAASALERITIPEDVRERIADVMKPGSSLIISDNGMSGETGEYTDFVVSLR